MPTGTPDSTTPESVTPDSMTSGTPDRAGDQSLVSDNGDSGDDAAAMVTERPDIRHGRGVIQSQLKTLPDAPGVYRMLDSRGDVLYVGKAKSLKKRVASYTRHQRPDTAPAAHGVTDAIDGNRDHAVGRRGAAA